MAAKIYTLLLLVRDDEVLLAMKKRGFGAGWWNGVGGKIDNGETIEAAMVRESQEEIGVTPISYHKVAVHMFLFPDNSPDMEVHAFLCDAWVSEPAESEEMAPQWFGIDAIPYDSMWADDRFWLPHVLDGKLLRTSFTFDNDNQLTKQDIREVSELN